MTNINIVRSLVPVSLMSGIALVFSNLSTVSASLTGPGSTVLDRAPTEAMLMAPHGAAPIEIVAAATAGYQLILGLLLILLGFFLHAYVISNDERNERTVPVRVGKKKSTKKQTWFWIEMRI